ncbi:MAG: NAD-dependent epimerase/dehydratase family protein, partial [Beijerinckiaceae bacterium]
FIHAADAGAMLAALLLSDAGGSFNIGTGVATSIRHAAELLAARVAARDLLEFGALPRRAGDPPMLVADMTRTAAIAGMIRPRGLTEGIADWLGASDAG